jgi:hypothetical protein
MFSDIFLTRYLRETRTRCPSFTPDSNEAIVTLDSISILLYPENVTS